MDLIKINQYAYKQMIKLINKRKNESEEVWELENKKQKEMLVLYIYCWNLSWLLGLGIHHLQWF
jgi:predicted CopG family antitoxin